MSKKLLAFALVLMLGLPALYYFSPMHYFSPEQKEARAVDKLVARNVVARGGADAWQAVSSMRQSGLMDVGHGMHLPYVLEQKRPGKMCFEFVFDEQTAIQCADGDTGWKILPFRGRRKAEPMTEVELRETVDSTDPYGLLYDYAARDHDVELVAREQVNGRDIVQLKVTLPKGAVRWLFIDVETALEVKLETLRTVSGRERRVETIYSDWRATDGLLIARRQDTRTVGDDESRFLTVGSVSVNPVIDDSRFEMPTTGGGVTQ